MYKRQTVCLAIPLYRQIELLKKHWKAVVAGILSGVITSMASILLMSILFGITKQLYISLMSKSITTAIAIGITEEYLSLIHILQDILKKP